MNAFKVHEEVWQQHRSRIPAGSLSGLMRLSVTFITSDSFPPCGCSPLHAEMSTMREGSVLSCHCCTYRIIPSINIIKTVCLFLKNCTIYHFKYLDISCFSFLLDSFPLPCMHPLRTMNMRANDKHSKVGLKLLFSVSP